MMIFHSELMRKRGSQQRANEMIVELYQECPFTGETFIDGQVDASHIFPIGQTKFKGLVKYPIAAIPMARPFHLFFEWEDNARTMKRRADGRLAVIEAYVLPEWRREVGEHLSLFINLCKKLNIRYKEV